jgi:hypothetical protein
MSHVVCEGGLLSYRTLTSADRYLHGASIFIPGVLKHFDLPQVAAAVAGRRLAILDPLDAMKSAVDIETARRAYEPAAQAYARAGAPGAFVVARRGNNITRAEQYLHLFHA